MLDIVSRLPVSIRTRTYASCIVIFFISLSFGLQFKTKQLAIASPKILEFYPLKNYALTLFSCLLIFVVFWLVLSLIHKVVNRNQTSFQQSLCSGSIPFFIFSLSFFKVPISTQAQLFIFFSLICILYWVWTNKVFLARAFEPTWALILITLTFLLIFPSFSPLYHVSFFDTWGRSDYVLNLDHQWANAKAYEFLDNYTQDKRLGGYAHSLFSVSELSSLIVIIFDIPLADILSIYTSYKFMWFFLFIFFYNHIANFYIIHLLVRPVIIIFFYNTRRI